MHTTPTMLQDLQAEVAMLRQRVAVLEAVNVEMTRELDLDVLLQLIVEQVAPLLQATMVGLSLWYPVAQALEMRAMYGPLTWLQSIRVRLGEGITGLAAQQRRGVRVDDYQRYAHAIPTLQAQLGQASLVAEPVLYQERLLGVITVGRAAPAQPFTDADQELLAIFAAQAAVALENARLFQDVQQREARYRALVEGSVQGLSIFDQHGQRVFANAALARMFGYDHPEELLGKHVREGIVPEDVERLERYSTRRQQGQDAPSQYEYRRFKKDGSQIWIEHTITPVTWEGRPAYLATSVDITPRVRLEEQLQQYLEQLETLVEARAQRIQELERQRMAMEKLAATAQIAAGIAHEINNPLAGIKNAFFLIKEAVPPDHARAPYLELIDREIIRLTDIVRQMYTLYAPTPAQAQPCTLATIVAEVCGRLTRESQDQHVTLRQESLTALPPLLLPEPYLIQVLSNLIRNALQASPARSEVVIGGRYDGTHLYMLIMDQGPGIAPEHLPRLFEPFFTTKQGSAQGGLGLGLSIAHTLATAMGGRIEVKTAPGEGSTFTLVLPCVTADLDPPSAIL